jgi:tripartite-type tricarboxylate transporter receptor subunit TctC
MRPVRARTGDKLAWTSTCNDATCCRQPRPPSPLPGLALAQAYPTKPIRYIVPVAAGGGNDMIARVVTERWGRALGQTFVVDNQSGGGGVVACQTTARARADGYTLMQGYVATHGTTPATRKVSYDAIKDFTPIGMIGATPNVLAINANVPAKTSRSSSTT